MAEDSEAQQNASVEIGELIRQNVRVIERIEKKSLAKRSTSEVVSDKIAAFCGSMVFVWIHIVWFAVWLAINGLPFVPKSMRFDPPPFGALTLVVSLEAIFLSTFILISENRQQRMNDERNELDLQINLIAEQETSKIILMLGEIMEKLGIDDPDSKKLADPIDAEDLAEAIEKSILDQTEDEQK